MKQEQRIGADWAKYGSTLAISVSMALGCGADGSQGGPAAGGDASNADGQSSTGGGGSNGDGGSSTGDGGGSGAAGASGVGGTSADSGAASDDSGVYDGSAEGGAAMVDAGLDSGVVSEPCDPPADPSDAKLCLTFSPEVVDLVPSDPALDGSGQLYVFIYDTPTPRSATEPLVAIAPHATAENIYDLPRVDIDGLPETVYVRTVFVDNPTWPGPESNFYPGTFVGGYNLNSGLIPIPPLRQVDLTAGEGIVVDQRLTALRLFEVDVALSPTDPPTPEDDGQGLLSVGVFTQRSAVGAFVYGGAILPCVDIAAGPIVDIVGLFYKNSPDPVDYYFGAQVNDFNAPGVPAPGSIVSADQDGLIPESQAVQGVDKEYFVDAGTIYLTAIYEPGSGADPYSCPVSDPDAGSNDAGSSDAGSSDAGSSDASTD